MKLTRLVLIASVLLVIYACVMLCMIQPWFIALFAVAAVAVAGKRGYTRLSAFGTARWADADELNRAGMLGSKSGMIVGRMDVPRPKLPAVWGLFNPRIKASVACEQFLALFKKSVEQPLVRLTNAVHTAVFAPTGVGKGVSCVIPHLLTCPDSTVVVDFKGENFRVTAGHRQKTFGHRIVVLDPFKVVGGTDTFNPLDFINGDSPLAIDDCRDLAEALVTRTGQEKEPHWADSAEVWIAAMVAVVVQYGEENDRSLQTIRQLLTNPEKMQAVIKLMCESNAWDGMLSRLGHQLTQFKEKELGSVLTTTNRFLRFLDTLAISDSTKGSTFAPADLLKGRMTVYLILPPEHMRAQSPLLRMWIGSMLRAIVRGGLQEKNKVHFVLDEAASLGHMDALDDAVDKFRGYGVRLQFYYQSVGQLKKCFPEGQEQTLLSNTTQVFFGVNDQPTAEYISTRLGEATIVVKSGGTNTGTSRQSSDDGSASSSRSTGTNDNWSQQGRHLLKPDEVMALSERIAITFTPGVAPIWTTLLRYFEESYAPPGWRERVWAGVKMFAASVLILVLAGAVALGATVFANEKSQERTVQVEESFYR
jgi:type IV secretion system protein VirD4